MSNLTMLQLFEFEKFFFNQMSPSVRETRAVIKAGVRRRRDLAKEVRRAVAATASMLTKAIELRAQSVNSSGRIPFQMVKIDIRTRRLLAFCGGSSICSPTKKSHPDETLDCFASVAGIEGWSIAKTCRQKRAWLQ